jgi:hypothetical protein
MVCLGYVHAPDESGYGVGWQLSRIDPAAAS